ncbi:hypothetical protein Trydic_g18468 [Trypoxylus dichotomus]
MASRYRNFTATIHGEDRRAILDRWREIVDWFVGRETTVGGETVFRVMLGFKNMRTVFGVRRLLGRAVNLKPVTANALDEYERVSGDDDVSAVSHGIVPKFRRTSQITPSSSILETTPARRSPQPSPASVIPSPLSPSSRTSIPSQSVSNASRTLPPTPEPRREEGGDAEVPYIRRGKHLIEAAVSTGTYDAAMRMVERNDPVWYIGAQKMLSNYFEGKFQNVDRLYADRSAYGRETFVRDFVTDFRTVRVLVGRTGLGKTEYALAHFRQPLHVRDDEDWRRLTRTTDGIVLDDLDFRKWSPATFLKLLDIAKPVTQNIKYGSVRVPAGTPRLLIVNSMDLLWPARMHPETKMACERRMTVEHLVEPLFDASAAGDDGGSRTREERTVPEPSPSTGGRRRRRADRSPSPRDDASKR